MLISQGVSEACGIPWWPDQLSVAQYSEVWFKSTYCMGCKILYFEFVQSYKLTATRMVDRYKMLQVDTVIKLLQQRCMFWQHHSNSSRAHPAHGDVSNPPYRSSWSHTFWQWPSSRSAVHLSPSNGPKLSDGPLGSPLHAKRLMQQCIESLNIHHTSII